MKSSDVKYQPLNQEPSDKANNDTLSDVEAGEGERVRISAPSPNLLERIFFCPSRWTLFLIVIIFATLYVFTTLEVSFLGNVRSWTPTITDTAHKPTDVSSENQSFDSQQLFKSFTDMLHQFKSSISELQNRHTISNISALLPPHIQLTNSETFKLVERQSNLAAIFWQRWNADNFTDNGKAGVKYCHNVNMVGPHQIRQNNIYWQLLEAEDRGSQTKESLKLYILNAYYDSRLYGKPAVKLITTTDRQVQVEKQSWSCLLWFDNLKAPILSNVSEVYNVWPEYWSFGAADGIYGPQIMTCDIPPPYSSQVPQAISIQSSDNCSEIDSEPTNVLRVINRHRQVKSEKPSIGVCVQAFRFRTYEVSSRLVEWLEMVKLMGGERVYFYVYGETPPMEKVLLQYEKEGFVDWRRITLPGEQVNVEALYNYYYEQMGGSFWPQELVELNDCLYRNMQLHDYLIIMDIDEMIVPQVANNWHELLESVQANMSAVERNKMGFYENRHAYVYEMFEEDRTESGKLVEDYMYMLRHTYRAALLDGGINIKCFHRTDLVTAVHNHYPMRCLNGPRYHHNCKGHTIDPEQSILMHFRRHLSLPKDCATPDEPINCTIHDRTVWRWADTLTANVHNQLMAIFGK